MELEDTWIRKKYTRSSTSFGRKKCNINLLKLFRIIRNCTDKSDLTDVFRVQNQVLIGKVH